MGTTRTKEEQYRFDYDQALHHGIDRDTPGGIRGRQMRSTPRPIHTPLPVCPSQPSYGERPDIDTGATTPGIADILVVILLLVIIL